MAALTIDMTNREPVIGWEAIQPEHRSAGERKLLEAKDKAESAWFHFTQFADAWISSGNYEALAEAEAKALDADRQIEVARAQMNCPHKNVVSNGGGMSIGFDGSASDNYTFVCLDCGAEVY